MSGSIACSKRRFKAGYMPPTTGAASSVRKIKQGSEEFKIIERSIAANISNLREPVPPVKKDETKFRYLISLSGHSKTRAHIWIGNDTACRMWSTGGLIGGFEAFGVNDDACGKKICRMCENSQKNREKRNKKKLNVFPVLKDGDFHNRTRTFPRSK